MTDPRMRLTLSHMGQLLARPGWHYRFPDHEKLSLAGYDWRVELRTGEFAEWRDGLWLVWFKPDRMLAEIPELEHHKRWAEHEHNQWLDRNG